MEARMGLGRVTLSLADLVKESGTDSFCGKVLISQLDRGLPVGARPFHKSSVIGSLVSLQIENWQVKIANCLGCQHMAAMAQ